MSSTFTVLLCIKNNYNFSLFLFSVLWGGILKEEFTMYISNNWYCCSFYCYQERACASHSIHWKFCLGTSKSLSCKKAQTKRTSSRKDIPYRPTPKPLIHQVLQTHISTWATRVVGRGMVEIAFEFGQIVFFCCNFLFTKASFALWQASRQREFVKKTLFLKF